ncbi:MAG: MmgE/PrpD family protein, partial [Candidatus Tectomicrobia bacterium]|nr:MmgE/PrpD family protein [Candidatus Tectomicrobia bacterium]
MAAPISQVIAEYVVNMQYEDLPAKVVEMSKICFLDWLGSVYAGARAIPTKILLDVVKEMGGKAEATVIPDGSKSSSLLASLVNGASSHVVEMDDLHKTSIFHPGAPIIPAALAIAEREGVCGRDLITAIVLGYEIGIRVGETVGTSHYQMWHTTGTCGTFGAAVAAGKLLNLTVPQLAS